MRRASVVFASDSPADSVYLIDSGYVKVTKRGAEGKDVLIAIIAPGQVFGEQAITLGGTRNSFAEVLQDGVLYEIPRQVFLDFCKAHPDAWQSLAELLIYREREYEQKIGLLCLNDVETRILYYLGSLTSVFSNVVSDGQKYSLPLSQSEFASLIGATRETTSTTLNSLARRGLLKLGRRLLTVPSSEALQSAIQDRLSRSAQA
jgi:CRP-like cAMP-binding protein